ncbi:MAG: acyltransferase family protein [Roseimicrobium sp.]
MPTDIHLSPRPASSPLWKKVAIAILLLISGIVMTQDLTGRLFGKSQTVHLAPATGNLEDLAKLPYPASGMPGEKHLQRQVRVRQDGKELRGPYRSMQETREAGPGSHTLGEDSFWVVPYKSADGTAAPVASRYDVWVPKPMPHWLRWPLYLGLICLLFPKVRRYYATHPLENNKLPYLEALRGLACLVVVVTHFIWPFYPEANLPMVEGMVWYDLVSLHRNVPFVSLLNAGGFAVDTFFVLSGFVLFLPFAGSKPVDGLRIREALFRRPIRLWGVLVTVMVAVWFLRQGGFYRESSHRPPKQWTDFLVDLLLPYTRAEDYSSVFWTIRYELWGSILIYFFSMVLGGRRLRWAAYPILIWLLRHDAYANFLFGALLVDLFKTYTLPQSMNWVRRTAPLLFVLGLLVGLQQDHGYLKQGFDHWLGQFIPDFQLLFPGRDHGLVGALMIISALLLSPWMQQCLTHCWFNSLGRQSYSVYGVHEVLIHTFACWVLIVLVPVQASSIGHTVPHDGTYHLAVLVTFLAFLPVLWAISLVVTAFVDEPCIRVSRRIAKWITGSNSRSTSSQSGHSAEATDLITTVSGTVGSPDR